MSKKVHLIITAMIISAIIPALTFNSYNYLSAGEKKSENTATSVSTDSKISSTEFSPAAADSQAKKDGPVLIRVTLVILIIWAGISFLLIHIERKLKKIETALKD